MGTARRVLSASMSNGSGALAIALLVGTAGRVRCPWPSDHDDYLAYHDNEWGRPVVDVV